jgi:hypothetical protein
VTGPWEILETTEYAAWFAGLTETQQSSVDGRLMLLREKGPALSRPYADTLHGSTIPNLKELRVSSQGALRILFAFDPRRRAVLLLGGDKSIGHKWNDWYPEAIRKAEEIFSELVRNMENEG